MTSLKKIQDKFDKVLEKPIEKPIPITELKKKITEKFNKFKQAEKEFFDLLNGLEYENQEELMNILENLKMNKEINTQIKPKTEHKLSYVG